jgi:hypothetical protein
VLLCPVGHLLHAGAGLHCLHVTRCCHCGCGGEVLCRVHASHLLLLVVLLVVHVHVLLVCVVHHVLLLVVLLVQPVLVLLVQLVGCRCCCSSTWVCALLLDDLLTTA